MTTHAEKRVIGPNTDIHFHLNGQPVQASIDLRDMLLDVLRETFDLTGAKRSCDMQVCGACTVLVDGRPVSACTFLAYEVDGKKVETVEGLAQGDGLHPLQQAFIDCHAFQCGFCTAGMLMSAKALLDTIPNPSRADIVHYMEGNLCRCTGYRPIVEAIERVRAQGNGQRNGQGDRTEGEREEAGHANTG